MRFVTMGSVVEAGLRPDHFPVCKDVVDLAQVECPCFGEQHGYLMEI